MATEHPKMERRRQRLAVAADVGRRHPDWLHPGPPGANDAGCVCRWEPPFLGWPGRWDRFGCPIHASGADHG